MNDLITRLERAEGPDRELDAAIARATGTFSMNGAINISPRYTASVDAALTLVPEGALWSAETWDTNGIYPSHVRATVWVHGTQRCYAATPAIALCIAALRARQKDTNA